MFSTFSHSYILRLWLVLYFGFSVLLVGASTRKEQSSAVKATWISVSKYNTSPAESQKTMQQLKATGLTRVYVSVWNNGSAYFNSSSLRKIFGDNAKVFPSDQLSWAVKYAKENSLEVYAWFESGFATGIANQPNPVSDKVKSLGWELGNAMGQTWLDPRNSAALEFFSNLVIDVSNQYDIDGVLLDGLCLPNSIVGEATNPMTDIASRISELHFKNSDISASVFVKANSLETCNADLSSWVEKELFSEYTPGLFSAQYISYAKLLENLFKGTSKPSHNQMVIGLLCNNDTATTDKKTGKKCTAWPDLHQMLTLTSMKGLGASVWSVECVLETFPQLIQQFWSQTKHV